MFGTFSEVDLLNVNCLWVWRVGSGATLQPEKWLRKKKRRKEGRRTLGRLLFIKRD